MKRRELPLPIETELLPALAAVWHRPAHKLTGEALTPGSMRGVACRDAVIPAQHGHAKKVDDAAQPGRFRSAPARQSWQRARLVRAAGVRRTAYVRSVAMELSPYIKLLGKSSFVLKHTGVAKHTGIADSFEQDELEFAFQKIWTTCTNGGTSSQDSWAHAGGARAAAIPARCRNVIRSPTRIRSRCRSTSRQARLAAIAGGRRCNATSRWYCPQTA